MPNNKGWSDLTARQKRVVVAAAVVEGVLKAAALRDLRQRPAEQVRGPKKLWALTLVLVNGGGAAPLTYFTLGRRR